MDQENELFRAEISVLVTRFCYVEYRLAGSIGTVNLGKLVTEER